MIERCELVRKWLLSGFIVVHVISCAVGVLASFKGKFVVLYQF